MTYQIERPKKLEDIKNNRLALEKLGLMVWLDGIRLDDLA